MDSPMVAGKIGRVVVLLLVAHAAVAAPGDPWKPISTLIAAIKVEPVSRARTEKAERLAERVKAETREPVPEDVVVALATLMTEGDDSVRYWTATALGYLGPRAAGAVPALQQALKEIAGIHASKTSEAAIRLALKRIGASNK